MNGCGRMCHYRCYGIENTFCIREEFSHLICKYDIYNISLLILLLLFILIPILQNLRRIESRRQIFNAYRCREKGFRYSLDSQQDSEKAASDGGNIDTVIMIAISLTLILRAKVMLTTVKFLSFQ